MTPRAKKTQWSWRVNPSQPKDLNFFTNVVKIVLKQCLQKMLNMSFCPLKIFLHIRSTCFKLSECSPRLGLSNALRFMTVRHVEQKRHPLFWIPVINRRLRHPFNFTCLTVNMSHFVGACSGQLKTSPKFLVSAAGHCKHVPICRHLRRVTENKS